MKSSNKPEPLYLHQSELNTLDFWDWSHDEEDELAVVEWIRERGAIEVLPVGQRWSGYQWRGKLSGYGYEWRGISNPGEPLEQPGARWRAVPMDFPAYEFDLPNKKGRASRQKQPAMPGLPWKQRSKRRHQPAFRYCVYCGQPATHNILKQTYCEAHYRMASIYRALPDSYGKTFL